MLWPPTRPAKDLSQWMVRRSSFSRNCRSSSGAAAIYQTLCGGGLFRYALDDAGQNRIRRLSVGVSVEIEDDAMAQNRRGDELNVVDAQVVAAAHESQHAAAFDQRLRAARRAAVADVLLRQLVRLGL